ETPNKPQVKYAEQYRHSNKKPNVKGNQRNWNNLKSYQLGPEFVLNKKAFYNCGDFSHLANVSRKKVQWETSRSQNHAYMGPSQRSAGHRPHGAPMRPPHISVGYKPHRASMRPSNKPAGHRPHGPSMNPIRPNMNGARPNRSFFIQAPSYETRPFLKSSAVKTQYRAPWVSTVNRNNPPVNRKFSTGRRNFPTVNRKFPTASKKFTTGSTKIHTADMGKKGKAAHDALLESSLSKPHDESSSKVPEGSGHPIFTASSSHPPADQMETLTVESLILTKVWTLVDCPKGVRPIRTKWVLKNKKDERGIVVRNKARLVAQGHTQEEGIDYDEVFEPVARIEAIRLFLAYASFMGFIVYQIDVKSAFLYGTTDEEAPRAWYGTLSKYLLKNGFQRGTIDQTLFIRRQREDFILVQVYVDDIIFSSSNPQLCREFESLMHEKFQMSAMGDILKKFGYSDVRSLNTPMDKENPWGKDGNGKDVTPKECHLHAVKRIFRYLKGHPKLGLWYLKASPFDLVAFSYSDYGGASQDRKSSTGGSQFLGKRLISWQCKKQTIVATSTTKAEYVAAASCCGQVLWIQNQLLDYGVRRPKNSG
nr:hypothetical protein [Tanacetum cinerariifolium]